MDKNKQKGKGQQVNRKSPQRQRKVSPKKSPTRRSKSPSRRTPSPKPIGPRRRVAPFPISYNEPAPKTQLQQLYEETLKFMKDR